LLAVDHLQEHFGCCRADVAAIALEAAQGKGRRPADGDFAIATNDRHVIGYVEL
jgi:hypothetical protein